MLTARGRRTIALGLVAGAAGRVLGIPELFGLATATVVVALTALVRVRLAKGTVTVSARAMPPVVTVGEPAVLELTIENSGVAGSLSTPVTLVTDDTRGRASASRRGSACGHSDAATGHGRVSGSLPNGAVPLTPGPTKL